MTSNLAWMITFRGSPTLPSLVWIGVVVAPPRGGEIYRSCDFFYYFYYYFYYFYSRDRVQSKPMNRFWRTIAQKTQSGVRMCLLGVRKTSFGISGVFYPKNTPKKARNRDFPAKTKTSNNFETLEDRQKRSMYHDYETGCSLSESVFKICPGRTLAEIQRWRHFRLAKNLIILQTVRDRGKVTIEH